MMQAPAGTPEPAFLFPSSLAHLNELLDVTLTPCA